MAHQTPLRASTLPLTAHPQAPRDILRAQIARSPLSPLNSATPISPPPSLASTSSYSESPISTPRSGTLSSPPQSVTPTSPPRLKTPSLPPSSAYTGSSGVTSSSPQEAYPSIADVLTRGETMSSISTMADSLPDADYIAAAISTPTPRSKRPPKPKVSTVSVFAGASGVTITGGSIITSGGSIIRGNVPEVEYPEPEYSEDEEMEVSSFKGVNGMKGTGSVRIVTAGGDVISGRGSASSPKRRGTVNVHAFTEAQNIQLGGVEMLNASEDVVLGSWMIPVHTHCATH